MTNLHFECADCKGFQNGEFRKNGVIGNDFPLFKRSGGTYE